MAEKEYIERGAALRHLLNDCVAKYPCSFYVGLSAAADEIKQLPTADVVEVRHGRWKIYDDGFGCELMHCSICQEEFYDGDNDTVDNLYNYCPNCGAKMDGKGEGE